MKRFILFLVSALLLGSANSASFSCRAACSIVEKLVCSDAQLSKSDEDLARVYGKVLASLDDKNKQKLIQDQNAWLAKSRGLCGDVACLRRSYQIRIELLEACAGGCSNLLESYTVNGEQYNLVTLLNSNERNPSFNEDCCAGIIKNCWAARRWSMWQWEQPMASKATVDCAS